MLTFPGIFAFVSRYAQRAVRHALPNRDTERPFAFAARTLLWFRHGCSVIVGTWSTNAAPTERREGGQGGAIQRHQGSPQRQTRVRQKDIRWPQERRAAAGSVSQEDMGVRKKIDGGRKKDRGYKGVEGGRQPRELPGAVKKKQWVSKKGVPSAMTEPLLSSAAGASQPTCSLIRSREIW